MTKYTKITLFLFRVSLGWMFFYAGITKVLNPAWSAAKYLDGAKTFTGFYHWLASPAILPIINFVNEWGLLLLGISLILGIGIRLSSVLGAVLMMLYYLPVQDFPNPNAHIIYITALLLLGGLRAGRVWGLEKWCSSLPICSKFPKLREWLG